MRYEYDTSNVPQDPNVDLRDPRIKAESVDRSSYVTSGSSQVNFGLSDSMRTFYTLCVSRQISVAVYMHILDREGH